MFVPNAQHMAAALSSNSYYLFFPRFQVSRDLAGNRLAQVKKHHVPVKRTRAPNKRNISYASIVSSLMRAPQHYRERLVDSSLSLRHNNSSSAIIMHNHTQHPLLRN